MKPRIVIADLDRQYILPLQLKFVKEFYSNIKLEIITDKLYFEEFLKQPQRIDILIVSEKLYLPAIQKHSLSYLYVMTENETGSNENIPNGQFIYKYTSLLDIFDIIIGRSNNILDTAVLNKTSPKIVLLYSANGGAGKSTLSLGLSANLAGRYKRVLYIDAEHIQAPNHLCEFIDKKSEPEFYESLQKTDTDSYEVIKPHIQKNKFDFIPLLNLSITSLDISIDTYSKIATGAKNSSEYDFIIIDSDTRFDLHKAELIELSDKVVIVYENTKQSITQTNELLKNINSVSSNKYIFIQNKLKRINKNDVPNTKYTCDFKTDEYFHYIDAYEEITVDDVSKTKEMHNIAFLVM